MTDYEQARMRFDILLAAKDYAAGRNAGNPAPISDVLRYADKFYEFVSNEARQLSEEYSEYYSEKCLKTKLETI